jgi:hypothetical protein
MTDTSDTLPHAAERHSPRIRRLAAWGQAMCAAGIVISLGTLLLALVHPGFRDHMMFGGLQINDGPPFRLSETGQLSIIMVAFPIAICHSLALLFGFQLFRGYRSGEIFTPAAGQRLARVGWCIVAIVPVALASKAILSRVFAAEIQASGGLISLSPTFSDLDPGTIAFGLLAIIVGRVLGEAARLSDENRSFV